MPPESKFRSKQVSFASSCFWFETVYMQRIRPPPLFGRMIFMLTAVPKVGDWGVVKQIATVLSFFQNITLIWKMLPKRDWILKRNAAAVVDSEEREVLHSFDNEAKIVGFEKANIWKRGSVWEQLHSNSLYSRENERKKRRKGWVYKAGKVKFSCIRVNSHSAWALPIIISYYSITNRTEFCKLIIYVFINFQSIYWRYFE